MFREVFVLSLIAVAFGASTGRVIGGQKAVEGQFPYMVALRASFSRHEHGCGGFIIASRWIGSVAHCMLNPIAFMISIAAVGTIRTSVGGTFYRFSFWLNHPEYNITERQNDIGIGRTRSEIIFTSLVQPIPLGSEFIGPGVRATICGWGTTDEPLPIGQFAEHLHWLTLTTITNAECIERMVEPERHRIFEENICTYDGPGIGACHGDSGSPLTAGGFVIGVVSWAMPCASKFSNEILEFWCFKSFINSVGTSEVYPRISSHRSWMMRVMAEHERN